MLIYCQKEDINKIGVLWDIKMEKFHVGFGTIKIGNENS